MAEKLPELTVSVNETISGGGVEIKILNIDPESKIILAEVTKVEADITDFHIGQQFQLKYESNLESLRFDFKDKNGKTFAHTWLFKGIDPRFQKFFSKLEFLPNEFIATPATSANKSSLSMTVISYDPQNRRLQVEIKTIDFNILPEFKHLEHQGFRQLYNVIVNRQASWNIQDDTLPWFILTITDSDRTFEHYR